MQTPINEIDFVIFDVETTGLNPNLGDRVCEIGAVKLRGHKILDVFSSLINPQIPMPRAAFEVNHISDEMLRDAPATEKIIPEFMKFIKGAHLVAYNARFDLNFLKKEVELLNGILPQEILAIDVLLMARRMVPNLDKYSLWNVAQALEIAESQEHRALSDAEITTKIFRYLLSKLKEGGIDQLKYLFNMFGIQRDKINEMNAYKEVAILRAIDLGARLRIKYFTPSVSQLGEREVTPYLLKEESGFKYLIGRCHLRKDERIFKIDNIISIELLGHEK